MLKHWYKIINTHVSKYSLKNSLLLIGIRLRTTDILFS